jgi:3'-phosphoadenosine 5'-phosphosulfate sulfotransferase (PAPS reductase)/FAD synthetase
MITLKDYDLIIINSSAGKDSLCSIYEICRLAKLQGFPKNKIVVSHQDLGRMEWKGTKELAKKQADYFGLDFYISKRRDKNGYEEDLLEYVLRRGKWPSNAQRYCTSDFKRGPGARVVTELSKHLGECKVLYVFGFRKEESPFRDKKQKLLVNKRLTTRRRLVHDYLPIHEWSTKEVWDIIRDYELPYHPAYDLGIPRLSCCFCIFAPFDALVVAGKENPELLNEYVKVEKEIDHTFTMDFSLKDVQLAVQSNYETELIPDWVM